ncbi:hypothetical protein [Methylomonas sp. HYX-M1]|uniref:hypothetical protein n=1 Tax=Methylomonas sp. HYX-M1 TaxID=3139307 RepID=UPI00345C435E
MNSSSRIGKNPAQLCAEWRADDGQDPRYEKRGRKLHSDCRQAHRFCKEVERLLPLILAGEATNPILRELNIISVLSEDEGRRLRVIVACNLEPNRQHVLRQAFKHGQAWLRTELARHFRRKRMPLQCLDYLYGTGREDQSCQ